MRDRMKWAVLAAAAAIGCDGGDHYSGKALIRTTRPADRSRTDAVGDALPDGAIARLGTYRLRHAGAIRSIRYSGDGRWIASWGTDSICRIWNAATGELLWSSLPWYNDGVFVGDGRHVAMVRGTDVDVIRLTDGKVIRRFRDHRREITWLAAIDNGRRLVTVSNDRTARIWGLAFGTQVRKIEIAEDQHLQSLSVAAVSPDGKRLAVAEAYGRGGIYDLRSGRRTREIATARPAWINAAAFGPDSRQLAVAQHDGRVTLWDVDSGQRRSDLNVAGDKGYWNPSELVFADGKRLLVMEAGGRLTLLDLAARKPLWSVATADAPGSVPGPYRRAALAASPDGKTIAHADGARIRLRRTAAGSELPLTAGMPGHGDRVAFVAFAGGGKRLISATETGSIRRWDVATGRDEVRLAETGHKPGRWLALSADGRWAASAHDWRAGSTQDHLVRLHDVATRKRPVVLEGHTAAVTGAVFSADGKRLVTAGALSIRIWDTVRGVQVGQVRFKPAQYRSLTNLALSPDGKLLAAMAAVPVRPSLPTPKGPDPAAEARHALPTHSYAVHVFDLPAGKLRFGVEGYGRFAFSPDGKRLAAAGWQTIRLLDSATGKIAREFACPPHSMGPRLGAPVVPVFSPDGRRLACGLLVLRSDGKWALGSTAAVQLIDLASGKSIHFTVDDWGVAPVPVFSPDSRILATGGGDSTVVLWDAGEPQRRAEE